MKDERLQETPVEPLHKLEPQDTRYAAMLAVDIWEDILQTPALMEGIDKGTIKEFRDLHDKCDANMLGMNMHEWIFGEDWGEREIAIKNEAQAVVDECIKVHAIWADAR